MDKVSSYDLVHEVLSTLVRLNLAEQWSYDTHDIVNYGERWIIHD